MKLNINNFYNYYK